MGEKEKEGRWIGDDGSMDGVGDESTDIDGRFGRGALVAAEGSS